MCFVVCIVYVCTLQDYYGGAEGGAIFNRGDIIVDGDALFDDNSGGVSKKRDGRGRCCVLSRVKCLF